MGVGLFSGLQDMDMDQPSQNVAATDLFGNHWAFRHVIRGAGMPPPAPTCSHCFPRAPTASHELPLPPTGSHWAYCCHCSHSSRCSHCKPLQLDGAVLPFGHPIVHNGRIAIQRCWEWNPLSAQGISDPLSSDCPPVRWPLSLPLGAGKPLRNLLTTNWNHFVAQKKLQAPDRVVLIR